MERKWWKYFLKWSETEEFKEKLKTSKEIIKQALEEFNKPYVAFSGGKDSTALLHLVMQFDRSITVIHWDYGRHFIPRQVHKEILKIARLCGAENVVVLTSRLYDKFKENAKGILGKCFIGIEIPKLVKQGYDCCFLALRSEESVKRRERTKNYREFDGVGIWNVFPIRDWTWRDVWAYIVSNKIKYLKLYDKYAKLLGYDKARFVTLFDKEFSWLGNENVDKFLFWKLKNI